MNEHFYQPPQTKSWHRLQALCKDDARNLCLGKFQVGVELLEFAQQQMIWPAEWAKAAKLCQVECVQARPCQFFTVLELHRVQ